MVGYRQATVWSIWVGFLGFFDHCLRRRSRISYKSSDWDLLTVKAKSSDLHHVHMFFEMPLAADQSRQFSFNLSPMMQLCNMIHITYQELKEFLSSPILAIKPRNWQAYPPQHSLLYAKAAVYHSFVSQGFFLFFSFFLMFTLNKLILFIRFVIKFYIAFAYSCMLHDEISISLLP